MNKSAPVMALNATKSNIHQVETTKPKSYTAKKSLKKGNLGAFWAMRGIVAGVFHPTKSIKEMRNEWLSKDYKESNL